jgi:transposase
MEIIQLVENSELSIRKTLEELDVPRSTFYGWYRRYQEDGYDGLADKKTGPHQFWNRIPESVQDQIVELALAHPFARVSLLRLVALLPLPSATG